MNINKEDVKYFLVTSSLIGACWINDNFNKDYNEPTAKDICIEETLNLNSLYSLQRFDPLVNTHCSGEITGDCKLDLISYIKTLNAVAHINLSDDTITTICQE